MLDRGEKGGEKASQKLSVGATYLAQLKSRGQKGISLCLMTALVF